MTETHPTHVPLSSLSIDDANVRKSGRGAEPIYVATIEAKGIIEPLVVRPNGKGYKVTNGGKRLASLQLMLKEKRSANGVPVTKDYPVPIAVRDEDDREARDTSLITNIARAGMHPVDQYEAFAELHKAGMSSAEIAARYAMKPKEVDQVLALGDLSPAVRQAWREDKIDAADAQAFTLMPDHAEQEKLFNRLRKSGRLFHWEIRRAITGESEKGIVYVRYIGEKAYAEAGGRIVKDLFGGDDVVSDPALARKLADAKLKAKIDALKADGWSWVSMRDDVQNYWSLGQIEGRKGSYTAEQKARSGCVIELQRNGTLRIDYGKLSPAAARAKKASDTRAARKAEGEAISNALALRLSQTLTVAAAAAIEREPNVAIAAAIAALTNGVYESPAKLRSEGFGTRPATVRMPDDDGGEIEVEDDDVEEADFEAVFAAAIKLPPAKQLAELARLIGRSLDFQTWYREEILGDGPVAALCNTIDGKSLNAALRKQFDVGDYFNGVNGAIRTGAVAEAVNKDEAAKVAKMKKADQVAWCIANVVPTGWLPPELRTAHYDGPGATTAKAKPAGKAKAGKKPSRKAE